MNVMTKFPIVIAGHRLLAELELPPLGEVVSLWMAPQLRTASRMAILRPAEIRRFIARIDD